MSDGSLFVIAYAACALSGAITAVIVTVVVIWLTGWGCTC